MKEKSLCDQCKNKECSNKNTVKFLDINEETQISEEKVAEVIVEECSNKL
jgi:beta-N-acetylglucosaminidase